MSSAADTAIDRARREDVAAICAFGAAVLPPHYEPLIGADAAAELVADWWNPRVTAEGVAAGALWVARDGRGAIIGVGELGSIDGEPVVYKLYVVADIRGGGVGARLLDAMIAEVPAGVPRVLLEHVAANRRAARFYEREGFVVDRVEMVDPSRPERDLVWRARALGTSSAIVS